MYMDMGIAIEPVNRQILALSISKVRNMLIAERFIGGLVKNYGNHSVSTDGVVLGIPKLVDSLDLSIIFIPHLRKAS